MLPKVLTGCRLHVRCTTVLLHRPSNSTGSVLSAALSDSWSGKTEESPRYVQNHAWLSVTYTTTSRQKVSVPNRGIRGIRCGGSVTDPTRILRPLLQSLSRTFLSIKLIHLSEQKHVWLRTHESYIRGECIIVSIEIWLWIISAAVHVGGKGLLVVWFTDIFSFLLHPKQMFWTFSLSHVRLWSTLDN